MSAAVMLHAVPALAVESAATVSQQALLAQAPGTTTEFQIPPQPLDSALTAFADQAGLQLLFSAPDLAELQSAGLSGRYSADVALARLLDASGFTYSFTSDNTVTVTKAQGAGAVTTLSPVIVLSETATKTDTPINEIPSSVSVIGRDDLERRGAQTLNEAIAYTPGVRAVDYPGGQGSPQLFLRGFRTLNFVGQYQDGLRGGFNGFDNDIELYGVEQVDVLRGPASVLYGQGEPGGLINMVSKRPTTEPFHEVRLQAGNFDRRQAAFDLSGPVDEDGEYLYRLTGLGRRSDTQVDHTPDDREYLAPAFTWRPDRDSSVTVLTSYLRSEGGGAEQSFPASGTIDVNPNGDIAHNLFLGEPDHNKSEIRNASASLLVDHRFNDVFAVHSTTRYLYAEADYDSVGARTGTLVDDRYLVRNAQIRRQTSHQLLADNSLETNFDTGPVYHTLLTGLDYATYERDETRYSGTVSNLDLFNPVYGQPISFSSTPLVDSTYSNEQFGVYAQEQMQIDRLTLTGNLRFDWVESTTENHRTDTKTVAKDQAPTWRLGAIYAFDFGVSPYASYSTSFFPQVAAPAYDGSSFDPTEGELYEVGVKYQPPGSKSFITASAFHITQTNVLSPDPAHVGYFLETGEVVSKGLELEGRLDLMNGLYALASYSYTDAKVTKDTFLTGVEGNRMVGVPEHMGSVWLDYTIQDGALEGLGLGAGARYFGESFDASNTNRVDGYTLVDATIRYDLGALNSTMAGAELKLEATNLFDTEYYTPGFSRNLVFAGYERRVMGTLTYRW